MLVYNDGVYFKLMHTLAAIPSDFVANNLTLIKGV